MLWSVSFGIPSKLKVQRNDINKRQMMASISTNKRRRTAADTLHISDLPVGFIVNLAEYLPKPTRAILAATLSAPSSSGKMI